MQYVDVLIVDPKTGAERSPWEVWLRPSQRSGETWSRKLFDVVPDKPVNWMLREIELALAALGLERTGEWCFPDLGCVAWVDFQTELEVALSDILANTESEVDHV